MKTIVLATAATVLAVSLNSIPAMAAGPRASSSNAITQATESQPLASPHYEWQYHYVGQHPRLEGLWVLVK